MEIERDEKKRIIYIWLTKAESQDEELRSRLEAMYPKWKQEKYLVAVFHSGKEDLFDCTLALLTHNKMLEAQKQVQQEKRKVASYER